MMNARTWRDTQKIATGVPAQMSTLKQDVATITPALSEATW
jgi:hypothetical protein